VLANHALRRTYATAATNAGVDEDRVGKLLNHGGRSVTSRYIKTSYLGRMLAAARTSARISSRRWARREGWRERAGPMLMITTAVQQ